MATTSDSPTVIDHQAFPHLVDKIISFSPHNCLLALRGASRAIRSRVDGVLAQHLIYPEYMMGERPSPFLVAPRSRHPLMSPFGPSAGRDFEAVCNLFPPNTPKVVDFKYLSSSQKGAMVARAPTIRCWHVPYRVIKTHRPRTYVLFGWPLPGNPVLVDWPFFVMLPWDPPRWSVPTRVVFNIDITPRYKTWLCSQVENWSTVSELVVVFAQRPPGLPKPDLVDPIKEIAGLVHIWWRTRKFKITFVNIGIIAAADLDISPIASAVAEHCSPFDATTVQECFEHLGAQFAQESPVKLEFLTLEEYKAVVGPKQFYIETDEHYVLR
ncbi:hypothetical protein CspHIS471_0302700 [Cutaneotrichosporon sp. HIS471]|nr:hypothetical protein CspHIS471_0302700 [Cutaneotrichosporon sp. HIS471]